MTAEQIEIADGIHHGVPFERYLLWPIMSQSTLKAGRASMAHLKYAIDHGNRKGITDAMVLGSALHVTFLEPERMPDKVVKWDQGPRRGKAWSEFCDEHASKAILTEDMHDKLIGMVAALRRHPEIRKWQNRIQDVEVSCVGKVCGVRFKGRADALTDDPLWDLKKISSTDDRTIDQAVFKYGYHIQAFIYKQLFGRDRFCLGFVEEQPPHDVRPVMLSDDWLKIGKSEATGLIERMNRCEESGEWPGRSTIIEELYPPAWVGSAVGMADSIDFTGIE